MTGAAVASPRMGTDARHARGRRGEEIAAAHLERLGYEIVARNHRTRFGELDLVAYDGRVLAFVEVKTRLADSGEPWESLHPVKQAQVRRMARAWLAEAEGRPTVAELRFDAIGVLLDPGGGLVALHHVQAAF